MDALSTVNILFSYSCIPSMLSSLLNSCCVLIERNCLGSFRKLVPVTVMIASLLSLIGANYLSWTSYSIGGGPYTPNWARVRSPSRYRITRLMGAPDVPGLNIVTEGVVELARCFGKA